MECRVEGRPRRDAFCAHEGAIVRLDLLGVIGTIAAVGLFVAGQRRGGIRPRVAASMRTAYCQLTVGRSAAVRSICYANVGMSQR